MIHYSPTEFVSLPTYKDMNSLQFYGSFTLLVRGKILTTNPEKAHYIKIIN